MAGLMAGCWLHQGQDQRAQAPSLARLSTHMLPTNYRRAILQPLDTLECKLCHSTPVDFTEFRATLTAATGRDAPSQLLST